MQGAHMTAQSAQWEHVLQLHGLRPGVRFNAHHRCPSADFSAMHKHASSNQCFNAATSRPQGTACPTPALWLEQRRDCAGTFGSSLASFWRLRWWWMPACTVSLDSSAPLP